MTPKEKAEELIDKFIYINRRFKYGNYKKYEYHKQCALIAVDEIIKAKPAIGGLSIIDTNIAFSYWQEVKQEIEKL